MASVKVIEYDNNERNCQNRMKKNTGWNNNNFNCELFNNKPSFVGFYFK